jgi:hypothetical protein
LSDWQGTNPFFLYVRGMEEATIDLDAPSWLEVYSETLSGPGMWYLIRKEDGGVVLQAARLQDDTLRYTKRVFMFPHLDNTRLEAYGFIREREDRHEEMWFMPFAGRYAMGNDVDIIANNWAYGQGFPRALSLINA